MMDYFDFETIADAADVDLGTPYNPFVTNMSGAQLHFKTAPCVIDALVSRAASGLYGWTRSDVPQYLEAVSCWMSAFRDWKIETEWIVPSYGILQAMCAAIRAFTREGDGIIIQPPVYVLYDRIIKRTGRKKVTNPLLYRNGKYAMDFENLENLMAKPENKLMLLCNPHNPIMSVWEEADLARVAALARKYGVLIVSDEIFAEHAFYGSRVIPFSQIEGASELAIVCTSIGKSFNFTGFSHANIIIPNEKIRESFINQRDADHYGSINPFIYTAVLAAYTPEGMDWIRALISFVEENIRYARAFMARYFPMVTVCEHKAGTLLWMDFRALGLSEDGLYSFLKDEAGILVDRGSEYGEEGTGFIRMQLGIPRRELEEALERLLAAGAKRSLVSLTPQNA